MTDFEYDCLQKKRIANQARHKKNGSKSKKCTLPSDRLTEKQWRERCGEILSYKLGDPMVWDDFKQMPEKIQEEYITNLQDKYNVTATDLAKMFGIKPLTVGRHVASKKLNVTFQRGKSMTVEQKETWNRFLNSDKEEQIKEQIEDAIPVEVEPEESSASSEKPTLTSESIDTFRKMYMKKISLMFSGALDINAIANSLRLILGDNSYGNIEIVCHLE